MVPAPITETLFIWLSTLLVVIPEIPSFPGLDEISPRHRVEDIHRRSLSLVVIFLRALSQIRSCRFPRIGGKAPGQYSTFSGIVVLPGYFNIIIRYGRVDKIPLELLTRRSRPDHRRRKILGILHHELNDTILVAGHCIRYGHDHRFITNTGELDHIAF